MTDHVKTLQADADMAKAFETRTVKVEEELRVVRDLVQVMSDQADAITFEGDVWKD